MGKIWEKHASSPDAESMNKEEMREFVKKELADAPDGGAECYNDEDFEHAFKEFDTDNSGEVSKQEMRDFIKKVAGLGSTTEVDSKTGKKIEPKKEEAKK